MSSGILFFFFAKLKNGKYKKLQIVSSGTLALFGISDFVEIYTGGFIPEPVWLLVWKVVCVLSLIVSIVWYVKIRLSLHR